MTEVEDKFPMLPDLYRVGYFVLPRLALEAMPDEWRRKFSDLLHEMNDMGVETPEYTVLRKESEFNLHECTDKDDPSSPLFSVTVLRGDPWADYRRGDIRALCPTFTGGE